MASDGLERTIGLWGATATLVGYVVGASIFILPGELAPSTGPAVFLSYAIAAVPALFSCFVTAQIGAAYPVSGAIYVTASRVVSPFSGFMVVWSLLIGITVGVSLVAYGLADYLAFFLPGLPRTATAAGSVAAFTLVNLLGARTSVVSQAVMVLVFVVALATFGIAGLVYGDPTLLRPLFPRGIGPVVEAAIPAFFSFIGFFMIADFAEEVVRPGRTIPRALALSFASILAFYTIVPLALVAVVPWHELAAVDAPVAAAAARVLPGPVAGFVSLAALFAAATTLNGILFAVSRDVFALARDRVFPERLAHLNARFRSPDAAVLTVGALALASVLLGATITAYATMAVAAIMLLQIIAGIAVLRLPAKAPERWHAASFRLSAAARWIFAGGVIVFSAAFVALAVAQSAAAALLFVGLVVAGRIYFVARRRRLRARGVEIEEILRKDLARGTEAAGTD